ncbi:hypothetical protein [Sporomusa malonica]|uniref:Uncharacterized protein n=1 Tax=Sporomusa malonica TaxID=112901 RepID=A0A1W2BDZ0_9FIRM|nr:hypothetical protein [Sporomusa malonica]SMC71021.1 hypothetical protein SAMN04488500_107108 [Sporomusa malonica]
MNNKRAIIQQENELTDKIEEKLQQIREWERDAPVGDISALYADLEKLLNEVSKMRLSEKNQVAGSGRYW